MSVMIMSWCPGSECDPCKKKPGEPPPPSTVPPPAAGGTWPTPGDAVQVWYYEIQDHLTNGLPNGGSSIVGIGAQWISTHGAGAFAWTFGPSPIYGQWWGAPYIQVGLDYFDGVGIRWACTGSSGEIASYSTLAEAQAVGQAFQQYFYG